VIEIKLSLNKQLYGLFNGSMSGGAKLRRAEMLKSAVCGGRQRFFRLQRCRRI
jgi:hypothetical protein